MLVVPAGNHITSGFDGAMADTPQDVAAEVHHEPVRSAIKNAISAGGTGQDL
jgi:hypothetical protein